MKLKILLSVLVVGALIAFPLARPSSATVPGVNFIASLDSSGNQENAGAWAPTTAISGDGTYVAFESDATNLVAGDTNSKRDLFVKNTSTGAIIRANVSSAGVQANNDASMDFAISDDGRYIVFATTASNLVAGDTNNKTDVFLHDMQTSTTELISMSSASVIGNDHSGHDGKSVDVSRDGRYVVFASVASNLVSGDTNGGSDIFLRDRTLGTTTRVSVDASGTQANSSSRSPSISCDGAYISFESGANNLTPSDTNVKVDVFVVNRIGGHEITNVTDGGNGASNTYESQSISCDGTTIVFKSLASNLVAGDTNSKEDVFAYSQLTDTIDRVSVDSSGAEGNNIHETVAVNGDGRYVVFSSSASNLITGDTNAMNDTFLRDRVAGTTERVSVRPSSVQTTSASFYVDISADGRFVTFESSDTGLVAGDTNAATDAFVAETGITTGCAE